ncbi:MAG TPA: GntR family transcriptional regulator [Candidatus Avoscillospira avistercoris]|uniref:GntR family transcriptional regulator n=1 Tax=Candidatus Avoscillospira avistercoris TaxID=2840707 RepID=A0A9D1JTG8_9FIRM|nr:GntR family transcriptional regulator [Candidatus Avoscillospira avistercoris]
MKIAADAPCSYAEIALHYLREQIINGELRAQEKLVETDIAQTLGISRGPVRDALKQLAVEGLVDYQPNRGCTVALLSPRDAYEVFYLRGNLEKMALEKCNCTISDEGLFIMENALAEMRSFSDQDPMYPKVMADTRFHRQIVLASQMDRLVKMWELLTPLNGAMFLSIHNANHSPFADRIDHPTRGNLVMAHEQILAAVQKRDLQEACRVLDSHYTKNGERVYRLSLMQEAAQDG